MSIEINARQIEEVKALLQNPQGLTLKLLEDEHKVSSKTIIRDVQILKDFFAAYGILLLKQKNSVLLDSREPGNWDTLLQYLREIEPANNILNIQGRRKSIYFNLLYNSPSQTSISTLAEEFLVSRSSIASDLSAIKQWAEEHNLSLIQSTKGTYIEGNEVLIRSEIARMIGFLSPKDLIAKYDGDIEMVVLKRMDKKVYAVLRKR